MASTDVLNSEGKLSFTFDPLEVLLGDEAGAVPASGDTFEGVQCVRVVQSASGSRLDFAELEHSLTDALQDREQPASFARMVQVNFPDTDSTRIHLGDYVSESMRVDRAAETLKTVSQLRSYHFGLPVTGYTVWDAIDSDEKTITDHIVFNPTIDNKTWGNRSDKIKTGGTANLWAHPETCGSTDGEAYQDQTLDEWPLSSAVRAMCELLNEDEEFIENPTDYTVMATMPPVRNIEIKIGQRLPQALDTLLIPHGFNWYVDYENATKPRITLFKIGDGDEKELKFQRVGEALDLNETNLNQFQLDNSIGDAFNAVEIWGEFEEAELTIPLYPGWKASADALDKHDLAKGGSSYDSNQAAWRLWIANEAGDIDPATSRLGQTPEVPDFGGVFTVATPHRRTLREPLTYQTGVDTDATPQRRPIVVEWSDDGGTTWYPEEADWTIKLCPDQIGILFDGKEIPSALYDAGTNARVRITGCVFGDYRVKGQAVKQSYAVNAREVLFTDCKPEKFQRRWRQATGDYASVLTGSADERDDSTEIDDYAEQLRDQNHYAEIACEFRLPGWHNEYKIGDIITKIAGREINLNAAPSSAPVTRYVQIVERRFENGEGGPSTILIVDRGTA